MDAVISIQTLLVANPDAVKGMVANPENREKAAADLMEKAGAKLLALYFTFGEYFPINNRGAERRGHGFRADRGGSGVSHLRTAVAMTGRRLNQPGHSASHSNRQGDDERPWVREGTAPSRPAQAAKGEGERRIQYAVFRR
jgi:hypothetical protein